KQLSPPTLDSDGKVAPVCGPALLGAAEDPHTRDVGSIIVVIATDAPLTPDQLKRLARRVPLGLGRAGAIEMNGSGDIFLAFSTANVGADNGNSATDADNPHTTKAMTLQRLASRDMDPLFAAVTHATEEAIDNALIAAKTMIGPNYWVVPALPQDQLKTILRKHGVLKQ
ncbi:MAG TPA: P1 family peptidase, partial [Steroidobacteraceae bacterium]|nr:P1 family peptidase [Steroidobacteraceae bacterium]